MLSKFYFFLKGQSEKLEAKLAQAFNQDLAEPYKTKIFSLGLMSGGLYLFALNLVSDFFKFLIILFSDSGAGFNVLFKQRELTSCPYSYHNYKLIRQKIRTFSFSTLTVIVVATVVSTLVLNLMFGGKLPGWAATFTWTQNSWTGGANTTAIATSSDWNKYYSKDTNINVDASGVSLVASSVVAVNDTGFVASVDNFASGTIPNDMYVNTTDGSLRLTKPVGATCSNLTDCFGGIKTGNCSAGMCAPNWISGPCANLHPQEAGKQLLVMTRDLTSTYKQAVGVTVCSSPQCYTQNTLFAATTSLIFSAYPAQNACQTIGGRLPTGDELACLYSNASSYNTYGVFSSSFYASARMCNNYWNQIDHYIFNMVTGVAEQCGGQKSNSSTLTKVRCVKGQ